MFEKSTHSLCILRSEFSTGDGRFWESYQCIDHALVCFRNSLPSVDATTVSQTSIIDNESADVHAAVLALPSAQQDWLEFTLTLANVSVATAVIQLHGIFADRDASEASVVLAGARDVAGITRTIGTRGSEPNQDSALPLFHPRRHHKLVYVSLLIYSSVLSSDWALQYCVLIAAQVLSREYRRRSRVPTSVTIQESDGIKMDLDILNSAINMMTACYPGACES